MAREKRREGISGIYHVILRGQDRLFSNPDDYKAFLELLAHYLKGKDGVLYAYSLQDSVVHLVASSGKDKIFKIIKPLCTSYARSFNRAHKQDGRLFYDRFWSEPLEDDESIENAIKSVHENQIWSREYSSLYEYENEADLCMIKKDHEKKELSVWLL